MSTPDTEANTSQYNRYQTQKINSYLEPTQTFLANALDQQSLGFSFVIFWFYFFPDRSSLTVMSNVSHRGSRRVISGNDLPFSHLETALSVTPSFSLSSFLCPVMFFAALCNECSNFLCVYHSVYSLVCLSCTFYTLIMS